VNILYCELFGFPYLRIDIIIIISGRTARKSGVYMDLLVLNLLEVNVWLWAHNKISPICLIHAKTNHMTNDCPCSQIKIRLFTLEYK